MTVYRFGDTNASEVIVQAIDERSLPAIGEEVRILSELTGRKPCVMVVTVDDWFTDLSPWKAPAVFGNDPFGDGAAQTLGFISDLCNDSRKDYYLGGYSLSGLFALWAGYQTDIFRGIAAASPSMWFPGFADYMADNVIRCNRVYLSLGDRETKTKNKLMATVGDCIKSAHDHLASHGVNCILEWNSGNHFADVENRCALAFAWVLKAT